MARRSRKTVCLPVKTWDRVDFLVGVHREKDHDDVIERAVKLLDIASCGMLDGGELVLREKDGKEVIL